MSPDVLEREEVSVPNAQRVPEGFSGHVVPSAAFGEVALDSGFTGAASRGPLGPYFSQLENLDDMVTIDTPYAPPPVRDRVVFVRISVSPLTVQPSGAFLPTAQPEAETVGAEGPTSQPSLAELTEQMRELVDLPVQDLARMCGIGRRQYYNLMRGKAEAMKTAGGEQRVRLVHRCLLDLHERLGSPAAVRAAVLMPLAGSDMRSLLEVGGSGDVPLLQWAYRELDEQRAAGATPSPDALPPSGTFPAGDARWGEAESFLRDHRPAGE
jgi:hypothetical protein